ncbi:GDYXXLXY domain-containing protein [Paenibacillus sp. sgz302251]|uniref:GDYXXLXY domain-containing protein n=1 Tax=Paenibacillus sp. sgz302251 TaxID=3414493 RepID=UPI003C7B6DD0
MGVSLLLAAIIYFFAANWSGLGRADKILTSAGIIVLFYGASYILSKAKIMLGHHSFLSSVLLVGGCISFGAAVALLNQIYNSHADSYELFLIWSIPALLFAVITRYNPFYILAYTLVHLTLWQYFYPTSLPVMYSDEQRLLIGGLFAIVNFILFVLTEKELLRSHPLKIVSFIIFHSSLLILSSAFNDALYKLGLNIACAAAIVIGFYYFARIRLNKTMLTLNALSASAFAVFKFFELMSAHASTTFFILGLVFVALLLTGNVLFFRFLNKLGRTAATSEGGETSSHADAQKSNMAGKIVSTIVTVIGILIGSISLIGLVIAATGDIEPQYILYAAALLLIAPVILLRRSNPVVRYTLLTIGYAVGMVSIAWIDAISLSLLFLAVSIGGWFRLHGRAQHFFTYSLINSNIAILLFQLLEGVQDAAAYMVLILTGLNALVYAGQLLLRAGPMRQHLRECGLLFTLLFLFWLTFMNDIFPQAHVLFNVLNFVVVTAAAFVFVRRNKAYESAVSLSFWFIYIAFKYYDLLWTLLHKSITLAILGAVVISITSIYAYRTRASISDEASHRRLILRKSPILIAIVIILQLGYIGYHTAASESLLSNGTSIKLQIEPLDPRSLLQGDYVTLNYSISTPPQAIADELEEKPGMSRIKVVLRPDDRGVYIFDRLYKKGDTLSDKEVIINGKTSGWQSIYYGIETYFVPEGTGTETEQNARFAHIKVSKSGDALLERLTKQ